ncbi:PQQ-binding-like beta-propeller repeat protein [Paraburkholderia youngii]|uniref:outer membrane protein assembly factor BamB family protein n=1 Tax=Paraburkholderia youngii TaxID=2782701 RepID=UPI003D241FD4
MRTDTLHLTCALLFGLTTSSIAYATDWTTSGNDLMNSRNQANEAAIGPKTAGSLHKLWATDTSGNVTATPALDDSYAYFPDSAGYLYKVDRKTGQVVWKNLVSSYTDIPNDYARATPAISGNVLILGNQSGKLSSPQPALRNRPRSLPSTRTPACGFGTRKSIQPRIQWSRSPPSSRTVRLS